MDPEVPLVVPEINPKEIFNNTGIIANPNCSTIQAVIPLKFLDNKYHIKRIVYSTYQAVSGSGRLGIEDLENKSYGDSLKNFHILFTITVSLILIFLWTMDIQKKNIK